MKTNRYSARAAVFLVALVGCNRAAPVPAPASPPIDEAPASAQPVPPVAIAREQDAAVVARSARMPSLKMLRDLAAGREDVRSVIDSERGVVSVAVGPEPNPETVQTTHVKSATRLCGPELASRVEQELRISLVNVRADDQMVCKDLVCVHAASGEWDAQTRLEFARTPETGRLILVAIERVLDVPLRPEAEQDFAWARQQREKLAKQRCR